MSHAKLAIFGVIPLFVGLFLAAVNWYALILRSKGKRTGSSVPILSGIILSVGLLLVLPEKIGLLCLTGLVLDGGSLPWLINLILMDKKSGKMSDAPLFIDVELVTVAVLTAIALLR